MDTSKRSHGILHSFCIRPDYRFENQNPDEEIILVLRAHPVTLIPWIINSIFLFAVLISLNFLLPKFLNAGQILFLDIFGIAFILAYIWFNFLSWFFNIGIVTSSRIIDVDFHAVIYREITATHLSKIEDVTAKSGGFIASVFNFGNVFVQTAGSEINIEFINIPRPVDATKIINDLIP